MVNTFSIIVYLSRTSTCTVRIVQILHIFDAYCRTVLRKKRTTWFRNIPEYSSSYVERFCQRGTADMQKQLLVWNFKIGLSVNLKFINFWIQNCIF